MNTAELHEKITPENLPSTDVGAEVRRRFRYQDIYTAKRALEMMSRRSTIDCIICEHHEDLLIRHRDGHIEAVQVKSRHDDLDAFAATDPEIVRAIVKFVELDQHSKVDKFVLAGSRGFRRRPRDRRSLPFILLLACSPAETIAGTDRRHLDEYIDHLCSSSSGLGAKVTRSAATAVLQKVTIDSRAPSLENAFDHLVRTLASRVRDLGLEGLDLDTLARSLINLIANAVSDDPDYDFGGTARELQDAGSAVTAVLVEGKRITRDRVLNALKQVKAPDAVDERQRIWLIPSTKARNQSFFDRPDIFAALARELADCGRVGVTTAALSGTGGVGKTQIAVEYAYRHYFDHSDYQCVFWINAESDDSVSDSVSEIAERLALPERLISDERAKSALRVWFETNSSWLLIIDNVDAFERVRWVLQSAYRGAILVTTQRDNLDGYGIGRVISVSPLERQAASRFFLARARLSAISDTEREEVDKLAGLLGYLPLALELAAAFVARHGTAPSAYMEAFNNRVLEMLDASPGVFAGMYDRSVRTAWAVSFAEVERYPATAHLLEFSAILGAEDIPYEVLTSGARHLRTGVASELRAQGRGLAALDRLLTPLADYSLIRRNSATRTYSIHRLVREVARERMGIRRQRMRLSRAVKALHESAPPVQYSYWDDWTRLVSHIEVCASQWLDLNMKGSAECVVFGTAGFYLRERAQYGRAERLLTLALDLLRHACGENSPEYATCVLQYALLRRDQGLYDEAEELSRTAVELWSRHEETDPTEASRAYNSLGVLYVTAGRYDEAEVLYRRALTLRENAFPQGHRHYWTVAWSLSNWAELCVFKGDLARAKALYDRSLKVREESQGLRHPYVAWDLHGLAAIRRQQGDYKGAEVLLRRALALRQEWLGDDHPDVATSLMRLGGVCRAQGRLSEAEAYSLAAVELREKIGLSDHPHSAAFLEEFALVLQELGRTDEANGVLLRARRLRELYKDTWASRHRYL